MGTTETKGVRRTTTWLTPEPFPITVSRLTFHNYFCLIRQLIETCLQLHPKRFKHGVIRLARNPERPPIDEQTSREWVRDHIAIPARKEFFFEQAKTMGTMGSPLALAN